MYKSTVVMGKDVGCNGCSLARRIFPHGWSMVCRRCMMGERERKKEKLHTQMQKVYLADVGQHVLLEHGERKAYCRLA